MKLVNYFTIICSVFICFKASCQYTISGNIKDKITGETLPGVSIYIPEMNIGTLSDINGKFKLSNLKEGDYIVLVRMTSYKEESLSIHLKRDTVINLNLQSSPAELNAVVITGVNRPSQLRNNPVIVSTLNSRSFHEEAATNLIDALKDVPGVSQITTGPNISKPIIRGLGYNRVITLYDGIKQEGQQWGDEHGVEIDQYAVDRAEIIKGPGSLMYGSGGIAGVLNFLPPHYLPQGKVETQLLANYQSNNNLLGYSLFNTGNKKGFQWRARFSNKFAGNYSNRYDGKVFNSGFNEIDGDFSIGLQRNWGFSNFSFSTYNTKLGIVEGERDSLGNFIYSDKDGIQQTATDDVLSSYKIGVPYQLVNHINLASKTHILLKKGALTTIVGFQNDRRREFEDAKDPKLVGLHLLANTLNYNIKYNLPILKGWRMSVGVSGMYQGNENRGTEFLIPTFHLLDAGGFVYVEKTFLERLTLAGGVRFDNRYMDISALYLDSNDLPVAGSVGGASRKFKALQNNYNGFSGSLGLTFHITEFSTLKFNFSNGFRAPSAAEIAANGKHEGTFRYEIGNAQLKPEFSHQFDLAYLLQKDHLTLKISPFINFINNYAYLRKLNSVNGGDSILNVEDPAPAFKYASGKAKLLGGEIYIDVHPHPLDWLHIENAFSYVRATQANQPDSMANLPYIPAPHYRGGLKASFDNINKKIANIYVKFNVDYYFEQNKIYSAFGTEKVSSAYTLLSAGAGISFNTKSRKNSIQLFISAENLGNIAYQNHLSRLRYADLNKKTGRYGVFNMGRNFSIKLLFTL